MSFGNQNSNCPRSMAQVYNTSGGPLTQTNLKSCPRNEEFSHSHAVPEIRIPNQDLDDIESDFSSSNDSSPDTPPTVRGRPLNLEHEIERSRKMIQSLVNKKAADSVSNPSSPLRCQRATTSNPNSAKCPRQQLPTGTSRGQKFDPEYEFQRHQAKSNTCLLQNRHNILAGRALDLDRLYDYNLQAIAPSGPRGRPLDLQRDIHGTNVSTNKGQRAASCPINMDHHSSTSSKPAQRQLQVGQQSLPTYSPNRSISPEYVLPERMSANASSIAARSPQTTTTTSQRTQSMPPGTITKTVTTTTTTRAITPPHTPQQSPLARSANTSPVRSPDRSLRQDFLANSSLTQDNFQLIDSEYGTPPSRGFSAPPSFKTPGQTFNQKTMTPSHSPPQGPLARSANTSYARSPDRSNKQHHSTTPATTQDLFQLIDRNFGTTPQRDFAPPPSYKTPGQTFNKTTQRASPSLQIPDESNITYGDLTSDFNDTFETPQMESTRKHESINIQSPPRPDAMNYTNLPNMLSTTPQPDPSRTINAALEKARRNLFASPDPSRLSQQATDEYSKNLSLDQSFPTKSRTYTSQNQSRTPQAQSLSKSQSPSRSAKHHTRYQNESMFLSDREASTIPTCPIQNATRYTNETMDLSSRKSPTRPACPIDTSRKPSWQEDISGHDQDLQQDIYPTLPSCSRNEYELEDTLEPEYDSTEYFDLPQPRKPPRPMEAQTGSPGPGLFKCLANKLSSTYDFLSSFVTTPQQTPKSLTLPPQAPQQQTSRQYCDKKNIPESLRECAKAKRCGRVRFDSSDKSKVLDPYRSSLHKTQIEVLVDDTDCPGLIQATIDGAENFNDYSFNIMFASGGDITSCEEPPPEDPMTLLEAFSIRIEKVRSQIEKEIPEGAAEEQIKDFIHKHFANQNLTDLNRSIKSLLISERLQEQEQLEQTKEKSFVADVQKGITVFPDNPLIKIYVCTGSTRPMEDGPEV